MVIEMEADIPWRSTSNPKIPYKNIVKLTSSFDGSSEYVVFDRDYIRGAFSRFTVLTKWSSDYLSATYFLENDLFNAESSLGSQIFDLQGQLADTISHFNSELNALNTYWQDLYLSLIHI